MITISGAAGTHPSDAHRALAPLSSAAAPEKCPTAHAGLRFYVRRLNEHRSLMGLSPQRHKITQSCPRYLAQVWKHKARAARLAYERWHHYHYSWADWLPDRWQRIGACETGYGRRPGQWTWNSGTYQGSFGFHYGTWDSYRHRADPKAGPYPDDAYEATPRQQYEVALAVYRAVGYGAWGCA